MTDYGKLIGPDTLSFERLLPGPVDRVWEYLTDGDMRGRWFASGATDLREGGRMELEFDHRHLSAEEDPAPEKYKEHAEGSKSFAIIKKIDRPKLLVIEWEESKVIFELIDQGESVLLRLTHQKLPRETEQRIGAMAGWHTHLNILRDVLENSPPPGFWKVHMELEKEYAERL